MKKRLTSYWLTIIIMTSLGVFLNLLACIRAFCDFYADNIYGFICDFLGKIMDIFPFAVGEILMYLFSLVLLMTIVFSSLFIFLRKKTKYKKFYVCYMKSMLMILVSVFLLYTLNWIIPFRSSILSDKNLGRNAYTRAYTVDEIETLRNYMVEKVNETSKQVERDESGHIIYKDYETVRKEIAKSMKGLSEDYPRLKGYYPDMKIALCSTALEWMGIAGYNYPYTMEATYNKYITRLGYPAIYAHEISHHHGYYQEDEANFLSYLGCVHSDDAFIQYSGYIDAFYYLDEAYFDTLINVFGKEEAMEIYKEQPKLKKQVYTDLVEASKEAEDRYNKDDHPMEKLSETVEKTSEKGWEMHEKMLSENYYDDVVGLLLYYYDGKLY